jgi:hypothetical protein
VYSFLFSISFTVILLYSVQEEVFHFIVTFIEEEYLSMIFYCYVNFYIYLIFTIFQLIFFIIYYSFFPEFHLNFSVFYFFIIDFYSFLSP